MTRKEESFTGRGIKETKEGKEEWRERVDFISLYVCSFSQKEKIKKKGKKMMPSFLCFG